MLSGGDLVRSTHIFLFECFCGFLSYSNFLYVCQRLNTKFIFDDTDVGPYRPPSTSPIQRRGEVVLMPQYAEDYQVVE
jgi:hypothetical protein